MNMPVPPFVGNAWEYWTIPEEQPTPEGCEAIGPTAGGVLVKRRHGVEVPYDPPTMPYWRLEYRMVDGDVVRTLTMEYP